MAYDDEPKGFSLIAMPAIRASRMPVVISRTVVWTAVCFATRKPRQQRGKIADVFGRILTGEADRVQSTAGAGLRGTLEQCFELGGRQGDQPVWFLVHGDIRQ